jgi:hypothetical protein
MARRKKSAAWLARDPAAQKAYRKRVHDRIRLFLVAADETTYHMMQRFAGLDPSKMD